jgi:hypothetical protein
MNSPNKPAIKSPGVPGNVTQVLRETTEKTAAQAKEAFEDVSAATAAAGNLVRDTYSTAARSAQEYNAKVIEFAQTNTQTNLEFVQKLCGRSFSIHQSGLSSRMSANDAVDGSSTGARVP